MVDEMVFSAPLHTPLGRRLFPNDPHVEKFVLDEIVGLAKQVSILSEETTDDANRQYS
jgi:hypothetical protein